VIAKTPQRITIETAADTPGVPRGPFVCWRVELIDPHTGAPLRLLGAGQQTTWEDAARHAVSFVYPVTQ